MAAIMLAILVPLLAQDKQDKPEEAQEMKWTLQEGDRFDLKWTYNEQRRRDGQDKVAEGHDKRDVDAELTWKSEGILALSFKKVTWSYGSQDYEINLAYFAGKKLMPDMKMK